LALRVDALLVGSAALRFLALFARAERYTNLTRPHASSSRFSSSPSTLLVVPFHVPLLTCHVFSWRPIGRWSLNIRTSRRVRLTH
jgi:hypothetical protein